MHSRALIVSLALAAVALAPACTNPSSSSSGGGTARQAASAVNPDMVVAEVLGEKITMKQVDEVAGKQVRELEKKIYGARRSALDQMVVQKLVLAEAKAAGMDENAFLKKNIDDAVPAPSEERIQAVFDENKSQMPPGSTVESMRAQIIGFLTQRERQEAAMKFFEGLKAKASVKDMFPEPEEPRITVEAKGPSRGPEGAKVTIVEFSDFECPYCSRAEEAVTQVMEAYAGKVRLVYRHYPLPFHPNARPAAEAAACAAEQGKFWEYHKVLFANQQKLAGEELKAHAQGVPGLDAAKFNDCVSSGRTKGIVDADMAEAQKAGVNGTPAFFVNGVLLSGAMPFGEFKKIIDRELAR